MKKIIKAALFVLFYFSMTVLQSSEDRSACIAREENNIITMIDQGNVQGVVNRLSDLCNEEMMSESIIFQVRDKILAQDNNKIFAPVHEFLADLFVNSSDYWNHSTKNESK